MKKETSKSKESKNSNKKNKIYWIYHQKNK
jgi:hypothetical protein